MRWARLVRLRIDTWTQAHPGYDRTRTPLRLRTHVPSHVLPQPSGRRSSRIALVDSAGLSLEVEIRDTYSLRNVEP
jgi:hypothetical protein